ncbi:MAG: tetratricopeptide repeat protein [Candidatus Acidiferrales bacterium]
MAFNKIKAQENALKYLNQGKVAQAIAEYQQILRNDGKDQATLMTVGDLFARQGDMPQAIEYFERLAQVYLNDGFNSKAIAIYKKIAKLAPNELPPLERLADLYVQQGVLSEARPLFLQIAEAHLKANKAPKAVEVLHRLLEVEPENLRVQMRLAELYNVMGQKKEAALTYLAYAQRLFDRSEFDEAQKLIDRALEVDPVNGAALLLKAKMLGAANKGAQAISILENHPEADAGNEVTHLLVDLELKSGQAQKAADRARKQLARGHAHFAMLYKVAESLIEGGQADEALPLLEELRGAMIEASEQEKFIQSLSRAAERLPGRIEPLEMLVDFSRHTSDPFRLNASLSQLSDAFAAQGNYQRAEEVLQELIDRTKGDERLVERLTQLKARSGAGPAATPQPADEAKPPEAPAAPAVDLHAAEERPPAPPAIVEEALDEETQRYIAQALTDVDLFSSYGLTQKATHLLENVLQRAPRHTPTLERLLDMHLGAGNERRTAELAAQLEQIHKERNDHVNADRFAELRQRFQKAAGLKSEELPAAPPMVPQASAVAPEAQASAEAAVVEAAPVETAPAPSAAHPEFEVALVEAEPEATEAEAAAPPEPAQAEPAAAAAGDEVDLSDEWEAISKEVEQSEEAEVAPAVQETIDEEAPAPSPAPAAIEPEPVLAEAEVEAAPAEEPAPEILEAIPVVEEGAPAEEEEVIELVDEPASESPTPEKVAAGNGEFELELMPHTTATGGKAGAVSTEDLISELVAEIDEMEAPMAEPAVAAAPEKTHERVPEVVAATTSAPMAAASSSAPVGEATAESLNQLAEVFQEFRSELGELGEEDEDLETHYNLGIAYREMGLLDEAIGEFQKVAKAVQKGKPFRYAMNCSTLLALSFIDKGEPKIASMWYKRALEVPELEQETILALRYDLGVAQEMAGESNAALDSFRQVYAMNIDYRDVSDRIATLQKQ